MSRTKNAIRNTKYAILSKMLTLVLSFVSRTIFIYVLGNVYLGVNGLYTDILNALSFAELGFGSALDYLMYAPIANGDEERALRLLGFYRTVYRIVACVILALGLSLLPFLQYIVKGADMLTLRELRLYFLLFLLSTVASYFVTYKYSYVNALQKNYLITRLELITLSTVIAAQILVILLFRSFPAYLITHTVLLLLSRFFVAAYLDRRYPILTRKPERPLSREEKRPIYREVRGLIVHQFASVAVFQTDSIIISSFTGLGVVLVGFVGNYNMLMKGVIDFVKQGFGSVISGFGNLAAASTKENFHKVFHAANFLNFWIYGFCSIAFFVLIPPFITLWIGSDKLIDTPSFLLIVINCYLQGQHNLYHNARIAVGDFNKDKWCSLLQAIVNLVVSIWGAIHFGLVGVYIGTVVSRLSLSIAQPYTTYSLMFGVSSREYYGYLVKYFCATLLAGLLCVFATFRLLAVVTVWRFLLAALIVAVLPNAVFLLLFYRSAEFGDLCARVRKIVKDRRRAREGAAGEA